MAARPTKAGAGSDPLHPNTHQAELRGRLEEAEKELKRLDEEHQRNRARHGQVASVAHACRAGLDSLTQRDECEPVDGADY